MESKNVVSFFKMEGKLVKEDPLGGFTYASYLTEVVSKSKRRPYEILLVSQDETMIVARKMKVLEEHSNLQAGHQRWKFETCKSFPFQLLKKIGDGWFWQNKDETTQSIEYVQAHVLFDRLEYLSVH